MFIALDYSIALSSHFLNDSLPGLFNTSTGHECLAQGQSMAGLPFKTLAEVYDSLSNARTTYPDVVAILVNFQEPIKSSGTGK